MTSWDNTSMTSSESVSMTSSDVNDVIIDVIRKRVNDVIRSQWRHRWRHQKRVYDVTAVTEMRFWCQWRCDIRYGRSGSRREQGTGDWGGELAKKMDGEAKRKFEMETKKKTPINKQWTRYEYVCGKYDTQLTQIFLKKRKKDINGNRWIDNNDNNVGKRKRREERVTV